MSNGIYAAMAAIQADFPAVTKGKVNPSQKYKFRGIDDALAALNPLLSKHGVFMIPEDQEVTITEAGQTSSGTKTVRALFRGKIRWYHADGSSILSMCVGEGLDFSDKAVMKAQANALKYLIWYTFAVPTDEVKDSEAFKD